jgi:hypothetical protein
MNNEMLSYLEQTGLPVETYQEHLQKVEQERDELIRRGLPVFPSSAITGIAFVRLERELSYSS